MEETTEQTNYSQVQDKLDINFNTGEKTVTVSIPHIELDKFATAIYWFCKENKIDATLEIKDNATLTTSED